MAIPLVSDPRVSVVPVIDDGEPLVRMFPALSPSRALVRRSLAERLMAADLALPAGIRLQVVEGYRSMADQQAISAAYSAELCAARPGVVGGRAPSADQSVRGAARGGAAVAGAAVDLTLVDACGEELDLGTPIDATPEPSDGRCCFAAVGIGADARAHWELLARVLTSIGLVNYSTEWWHWSYGDRYRALVTGAPHALYGPASMAVAA